jgi:uncharacterized protein (TIGR00369 family)
MKGLIRMKHKIPETQAELEASLKYAFDYIKNKATPGTITSMMKFDPVSCDLENRTLTVSFDTLPWMSNISGVLHGGLTASVLDSVMGLLILTLIGKRNVPTITLQTNYLRPIPTGNRIIIKVRADYIGRTTAALAAEIWLEDNPKDILATASGIYHTASAPLSVHVQAAT